MADRPWLTIVGLGEDGPDGLSHASLAALNAAEIVMGPPRHLSLLPSASYETIAWPVPFADGISRLLELRGRNVVVLASGDPFWFGAGSVITRHLERGEWRALPAPSTFSHVAARMGWPLEQVVCLGLHAAPLSRLRPHLAPGIKFIVLLRDGDAVQEIADYLDQMGFSETQMTICEAVAGSRERIQTMTPSDVQRETFDHPVCVALDIAGNGLPVSYASGLPDDLFDNDGQITKRPIRALTLSALAPRHGEHLWDIGGGSGSVAIEWLLSDASLQATSVEVDATRAERITANAARLGVDRLQVVNGKAPAALKNLERPDAVFVGGGLSRDLLDVLATLDAGTRLVINAVTLENQALLTDAQHTLGGMLSRVDIAQSKPLGTKRGWEHSYPIVQWSVTL